MVASPEICRMNGAKSRGPVTARGKAIAAKNATKHGLLATQPPLVMGEDLESFQGILQGLIDEYQPENATEHLLIQQVAMGWLRLHRLWGVEAAIANVAMKEIELDAKFPNALTEFINELSPDSLSPKQVDEKNLLQQEIQRQRKASKAIPPDIDRLAQYERHILRSLNDALDRLTAIQRQKG